MQKLFKKAKSDESAFSLVELLIVIGIIAAIMIMSITGYNAMKRVQELEQSSLNLYSVLKDEQRSALLFKRDLDESWSWGTVVSFEEIYNGGSNIVLYKYCAPDVIDEFQTYPKDTEPLPIGQKDLTKKCTRSTSGLTQTNEVDLVSNIIEFDAKVVGGDQVVYVVFETVSGRMHFYGKNGQSLPLDTDVEIVLSSNAPTKRLIKFDADRTKIQYQRVDGDYSTN